MRERHNALIDDVETYTKGLNSTPNGWGVHIIKGVSSHNFLRRMYETYGQENVEKALNDHYANARAK